MRGGGKHPEGDEHAQTGCAKDEEKNPPMKEAQGKGREQGNREDAGRCSRFMKGNGFPPVITSKGRRYKGNCTRQIDSRSEADEKAY